MTDTQITLPAHRFFWARLDAGSLPHQRRRNGQALGYLLEAHLPVPIDDVQTAFAPLTEHADQYVACAMRREALAAVLRDHDQSLTLVPESCPQWLNATALSTHQFNLLHGLFEPPALRNARRLKLVLVMVVILTTAFLVSIGLTRRTSALRREVEAIRDARIQVMAAAVPAVSVGGAGDLGGGARQPLELRMLAELRSLRQTRGPLPLSGGDGSTGDDGDVVESFAQLVAAWPRELHVRTESILITPTSMTLRGFASTSDDVQSLANALATLGDDPAENAEKRAGPWSIQQPQISVTKPDEVSATLQWRRGAINNRTVAKDGGRG